MIVSIFGGAQLLEAWECRLTQLPDGRMGAIWRGLAFPLLASGAAIDVTGEAHPPSCCRPERPTARAEAFAIIEGVEEAYVLVAGSVTVGERTAAELRNAGFAVLRTGRYFGEPVDGFEA